MNTTMHKTLVAMASIVITAPNGITVTLRSWAAFKEAATLKTLPSDATAVITWADGHQEQVTLAGFSRDLSLLVRGTWLAKAGFGKPKSSSEEEYDRWVNSDTNRRDAATRCLKTYSLTDSGEKPDTAVTVDSRATISAALAPAKAKMTDWPAKAEIGHLITLVTGLIKRVEDPLMRTVQDAGTIDKVRMELRKASAALHRAEDLT